MPVDDRALQQVAMSREEYRRLVENSQLLLASPLGLNLSSEVVKYAEIKAALGGETAFQGASPNPAAGAVV